MGKYDFQIRVTGILIEGGKILLVKQDVGKRKWSLPGGRAEAGELLSEALQREFLEETGLKVKTKRLLYICDKPDSNPPVIHITFLMEYICGQLTMPTNEFDENSITDLGFFDFSRLEELGFSEKFVGVLQNDFPNAGNYMGLKENIGL